MEDRRIRKSKMALKNSLLTLLKHKSINKITVKELVETADINRSTFYCYYTDIYNMLVSLENEIYEEVVLVINNYLDIRKNTLFSKLSKFSFDFIKDLCKVIKSNADFCKIIIGSNGDISFAIRLGALIENNIGELFSELFDHDSGNNSYIYSFIKGGYISILARWVNNNFSESPEEIAGILYQYTSMLISTYTKAKVGPKPSSIFPFTPCAGDTGKA